MHTIEKKIIIIPVIIPFTQLRSRERRKLHFRGSNFTNFQGGGARPRTPLGVRASSTQCSRQRQERCTSVSWTTASGTSKCYRKPWVRIWRTRRHEKERKFTVRCSPIHVQTNLWSLIIIPGSMSGLTSHIFTTRIPVKLRQIFTAFAVINISLSSQNLNFMKAIRFFVRSDFLRLLKDWKTEEDLQYAVETSRSPYMWQSWGN